MKGAPSLIPRVRGEHGEALIKAGKRKEAEDMLIKVSFGARVEGFGFRVSFLLLKKAEAVPSTER